MTFNRTSSLLYIVIVALALGACLNVAPAQPADEERTSIFDRTDEDWNNDTDPPAEPEQDPEPEPEPEPQPEPEPEPEPEEVEEKEPLADWILLTTDGTAATASYRRGNTAGTTIRNFDGTTTDIPEADAPGRTIVELPDGQKVSVPNSLLGKELAKPQGGGTFTPTADGTAAPVPQVNTSSDPLDAIDWNSMSPAVRDAKAAYDTAMATSTATYTAAFDAATAAHDEALAKALAEIEKKLDKALSKAMQDGDVDEATNIRSATEQSRKAIKSLPDPREIAVGEWAITYTQRRPKGTLTLLEDGTATWKSGMDRDNGSWKLTDSHIMVTWRSRRFSGSYYWDALRLPIAETGTIVGDTWTGCGAMKARKK